MKNKQTTPKSTTTHITACFAVLACYGLSPALNANTIVVTNTNDSGRGSLREAVAVAKDGDTIDATGVSGTIFLTSGELQIRHPVRITGPGARNLAINGNFTFTVFENFVDGVTISGFTITRGGGIINHKGLTLSNSDVVNNGVGISNNSVIGDPCTNLGLATLTIINCTVSGNHGGGISNIGAGGDGPRCGVSSAKLTVSNCTISGNSASNGGGIYNVAAGVEVPGSATVAISNSTLHGNSVTGDGGGIFNGSASRHSFESLTVKNSTISGNSAPAGHGGGIYNDGSLGVAELELGSTILNKGSSGQNIVNHYGTVTSLGYNLANDNGGGFLTGPGDQINTHPMLGLLQDNGGRTFTQALLPGSPAINAGNPNFTPPPSFDQRGSRYPRVVNGRSEVGSFEVQ